MCKDQDHVVLNTNIFTVKDGTKKAITEKVEALSKAYHSLSQKNA